LKYQSSHYYKSNGFKRLAIAIHSAYRFKLSTSEQPCPSPDKPPPQSRTKPYTLPRFPRFQLSLKNGQRTTES